MVKEKKLYKVFCGSRRNSTKSDTLPQVLPPEPALVRVKDKLELFLKISGFGVTVGRSEPVADSSSVLEGRGAVKKAVDGITSHFVSPSLSHTHIAALCNANI